MFEFPFLGLDGGHGRHVAEDFIFINLLFMFIPLSGWPRKVWDKYLDSIVEISMGRGEKSASGITHHMAQKAHVWFVAERANWRNNCSWHLASFSPNVIQIVSNMRFWPNWHWSRTGLFKSVLTVVIIAIGAIWGVKLSLIIAPLPLTADQTLISGGKGGLKSKLYFSSQAWVWKKFQGQYSTEAKRKKWSNKIWRGRYKFWAPL